MDLIFKNGSQIVGIKIKGKQINFGEFKNGYISYAPITGLQLSIGGILKEYPEWKDKPNEEIKRLGIKKFYEIVESKKNEEEIKDYLVSDLKKHGYQLIVIKKQGHRPQRIKSGSIR